MQIQPPPIINDPEPLIFTPAPRVRVPKTRPNRLRWPLYGIGIAVAVVVALLVPEAFTGPTGATQSVLKKIVESVSPERAAIEAKLVERWGPQGWSISKIEKRPVWRHQSGWGINWVFNDKPPEDSRVEVTKFDCWIVYTKDDIRRFDKPDVNFFVFENGKIFTPMDRSHIQGESYKIQLPEQDELDRKKRREGLSDD